MTVILRTAQFIPQRIFPLLLVLVCFAYNAVAAEETKDWLEILRNADAVYEKGVTASGSHHSISPPWGRRQTKDSVTDREWFFTQSGQNKALFAVSKREPQHDDESAMINRMVMLFDQKRSGKKLSTLRSSVPLPFYAFSEDVQHATLHMCAPHARTLRLQIDLFCFAMGRGVAQYLDLLDEANESVERNGEQCVLITAQSKEYLANKGTWKVYFLPGADYMIRHAQYLRDGEVELEIETFGINKKDGYVYPDKTEVKLSMSSDRALTHTFVLSDVKLEFDSALFDRVTREYDAEMPKGSLVIDESNPARVGPTARIVGNRDVR